MRVGFFFSFSFFFFTFFCFFLSSVGAVSCVDFPSFLLFFVGLVLFFFLSGFHLGTFFTSDFSRPSFAEMRFFFFFLEKKFLFCDGTKGKRKR